MFFKENSFCNIGNFLRISCETCTYIIYTHNISYSGLNASGTLGSISYFVEGNFAGKNTYFCSRIYLRIFFFLHGCKKNQKRWFYTFPNCGYFQIFLRYVSTWTMLIESPPMSKKLSPKLGFSVQTRTWATAFKSSLARSKSSEQTYPERSSSEKLNVDFRLSSYLKLNK